MVFSWYENTEYDQPNKIYPINEPLKVILHDPYQET